MGHIRAGYEKSKLIALAKYKGEVDACIDYLIEEIPTSVFLG
jgi:hypothetical protein